MKSKTEITRKKTTGTAGKPAAAGLPTGLYLWCKAAVVLHCAALTYLCFMAYCSTSSTVLDRNGSSRFAYKDHAGAVTEIPIEAASLMRIALALESVAGTGPTSSLARDPHALRIVPHSITLTEPKTATPVSARP